MTELYAHPITVIIVLSLMHWVGDGVLQDEKWAKEKNHSLKALLKHTSLYSVVWILPILWLTIDLEGALLFTLITFVAHTLTDFVTSKIVSRKFKNGDYGSEIPNVGGFSMIVMDQGLHAIQLGVTYYYLFC